MKGCKIFAVNIQDVEAEREQKIKDFLVLMDFKDVFTKAIPRLPPKRDLYFSIELTPRSILASKSPYCMSAPELVEHKLHCTIFDREGLYPT